MSGIGERALDLVNHLVVERPLHIVIVVLVVTGLFATGLGNISTESGTEQFSEDVAAYDTYESVQDKFESPFDKGEDTTQLIQSGDNVLSKKGLLRMLTAQHRLEERTDMRVSSTNSAARMVAREIDPSARTLEDQIRVVEQASQTEVRSAVRRAAESPSFAVLMSDDFNPKTASASATLGVVKHAVEVEASDVGSGGSETQLTDIQLEAQRVVGTVDGDIRVFGSGIINYENSRILEDSLKSSIPAVIILLILFLAVSYRDPFDLLLGVVSLSIALIWTFGFMGLADIPFTQLLVSLPPLLLAIGVDFGVHAINRYREERLEGYGVTDSMDSAIVHLVTAFFLVTGTSVIGFSANMTSGLTAIRDFGMVAAAGISFVAIIFGLFLPAAKLLVERLREGTRLPAFDSQPLGSEDSLLGRALPLHLRVTGRLPKVFLAIVLVSAAFAGYYGKDVDSSFEDEDFLPPEELPSYLHKLPEQMAPGDYTTTENTNFLKENFETSESDTVTVYVTGPLRRDDALESIHRAGDDPPSTFVVDENNHARSESIITVIDAYARESPEFAQLVRENDVNNNGIPDDNLEQVYDALLQSEYRGRALEYVTDDYQHAQVVYSVETDASRAQTTADASRVADQYRFEAVETGGTVVFQRVADTIFESAVSSLTTALLLSSLFLLLIYYLLEGRMMLGLITLLPILVTATFLVGTMRHYDIPFNTLTATILSITVGIGIDYSIHVVHRFVDEFKEVGDSTVAAVTTLRGTGGALFGSMLTTISGSGALYLLSITPLLKQFGLLMTLSVTYSFIASIVVLPVALIAWADW